MCDTLPLMRAVKSGGVHSHRTPSCPQASERKGAGADASVPQGTAAAVDAVRKRQTSESSELPVSLAPGERGAVRYVRVGFGARPDGKGSAPLGCPPVSDGGPVSWSHFPPTPGYSPHTIRELVTDRCTGIACALYGLLAMVAIAGQEVRPGAGRLPRQCVGGPLSRADALSHPPSPPRCFPCGR